MSQSSKFTSLLLRNKQKSIEQNNNDYPYTSTAASKCLLKVTPSISKTAGKQFGNNNNNGSGNVKVAPLPQVTVSGSGAGLGKAGGKPVKKMSTAAGTNTNTNTNTGRKQSKKVIKVVKLKDAECMAEIETQPPPMIPLGDSETIVDLDKENDKTKKIMSLVMSVNEGINIPSGILSNSENRRSRPGRRGSGSGRSASGNHNHSVHNYHSNSSPRRPSGSIRKTQSFATEVHHVIPEGQAQAQEGTSESSLNQTISADHGVCDLSSLIDNIISIPWKESGGERSNTQLDSEEPESNIPSNIQVQDEGIIEKAYDILNAGLKIASSLMSTEEFDYREDKCTVNGYSICVAGRRLLLEGIHVNLDFRAENACLYAQSDVALKPRNQSRTKLEEGCDGKRIRIVIRLKCGLQHSILHSERKWTLVYGESSLEKVENYVEIVCPIGVHLGSLKCSWEDSGLLYIDVP